MLFADGDLSRVPGKWIEFLSRLGEDTARAEKRFIARNFLLDEGVGADRASSYLEQGAKDGYVSEKDWGTGHAAYLADEVNLVPGGDLPRRLDPGDDVCPETFRRLPHDSPFLRALPNLPLIRMERVDSIARIAQLPREEVSAALKSYLERGEQDDVIHLGDILEQWNAHAELRPTYAGFLDDFRDLLGGEEEPPPDWPDRLRDALGLLHHDPRTSGGPIEIVVIRYPVSEVPAFRGAGPDAHPLVPPCVLDGRFSAAFCPSPRNGLTGHVADLSANVVEPRREIVHPTVRLRTNHVWRIGTITKPVENDFLPEARGLHLDLLRNHAARPDYALGTDADLL